jgi:PleD family two-component response regulator
VVTASAGVASAATANRAVDGAALVRSADGALYEAKRKGRDRVVCASEVQTHLHRVA